MTVLPKHSTAQRAGPPLRIGMIGAGFIAQIAHLHAFSQLPDARVVALAEPDDNLRCAVVNRFGISNATARYEDILRNPDIDAVVVCVPRHAQPLVVTAALSGQRPVLSEKPMAMTLDEATAMVSAATRARTPWMIGYMKRYDPGVQRFADLLSDLRASGEMGPILDASLHDFCATYGVAVPDHIRRQGLRPTRYPQAPTAPDFVAEDLRADYDYTLNVASHDINLLRLFFGDNLAVTRFAIRRHGAQRALFDAGDFPISMVVAPADLGRWDQRLDVTFRHGRISLILPSPLDRQKSANIRVERPNHVDEIDISPAQHVWAFQAQARAFVDHALLGTKLDNSGAAALSDISLIDRLWRQVELR